MRKIRRVALPNRLPDLMAVWASAAWTAAGAHLTSWRAKGSVPAILFLTDAERFGRSGLPDPEAYSHALGTPTTLP